MRHSYDTSSEPNAALERAALQAVALEWAAHDPDPATAAQLRALSTDPDAGPELADSFAHNLQFGTAGLRAAMGPGPNRMNRVVVRRAAAGLATHLLNLAQAGSTQPGTAAQSAAQSGAQPSAAYRPRAVVGFDARHNSEIFAQETAAVFTAAGIQTFLLPRALPTPVLAYAVRALDCEAGVMVTASHNPPADNGYKVYLGARAVEPAANGVQIVAPHDSQIAAAITAVADTRESGDTSGIPMATHGWTVIGKDLEENYIRGVSQLCDPTMFPARELRIVHTSMHGVGHETALAALHKAGFTDIHPVPEQSAPDPEFPTVSFPNPEEPGAMDLAFALAQTVGADVVLANDPDADRVAVGAVDPDTGLWHKFHGDQVGALLGAHLAARLGPAPTAGSTALPVFANSIVSSRLLAKIAASAGFNHAQTLTGFKWISRVPNLRYGYEEALGYCVAPDMVRDKDGISAGLLIAEMAAALKAQDRTLFDVLDDLALAHGLHASDQMSVRVSDLAMLATLMDGLRRTPPAQFAGAKVVQLTDLSAGTPELPATDGLLYLTENATRVIVRPSGTEPKLKCYVEVIVPVADRRDLAAAKASAQEQLAAVAMDLKKALGIDA